jgi:signal transduction histidine kinase
MLAVLVGALLVTMPVALHPLPNTKVLLPAYAAAVMVNELITAALLLTLSSVHRMRAVLILAAGYMFSGMLVVPWALTFPGVFAVFDLNTGLQSTAWIAALRRLGFPASVILYALLKPRDPSLSDWTGSTRAVIGKSVVGTIAVVCCTTWLIVAAENLLPQIMQDTTNAGEAWRYVSVAAIALYLSGLAVLWARPRSMLDFWLMIVLCTLLFEIVLLSYVSAGIRFSVGWWVGRLCGFASASIVLVVLLSETATLYARLARSTAAEQRSRDNRLTAMEAMSASIAHEINQPLASMVTNAGAGLRWLEKKEAGHSEVKAALERIVVDGYRASGVVDGIRTMFKKGTQERARLNVNALVDEVLRRARPEALLYSVSVVADLDAELPPVVGNPVQLQQVVSNLVSNAIDAMAAVAERQRTLRIRSRGRESGEVVISVEDSGTGLDPASKDHLFEPFFSTKPDGMGMGLMFCRSVIEAHGGRLWATDNAPRGAVFQFSLPADTCTTPPQSPASPICRPLRRT